MKLSINRESILPLLQAANNIVEKRQTLPILNNVLLEAEGEFLTISATDMEVELVMRVTLKSSAIGSTSVPARKLIDICRALPNDAEINLEVKENRAVVKSGRSRFALTTLPAADFPSLTEAKSQLEIKLRAQQLRALITDTQFAMANQDVRYYLNGLLLEFSPDRLRAVATDGHRLALAEHMESLAVSEAKQIIVPRKSVLEISRMLAEVDDEVVLRVSQSHVHLATDTKELTTKLIDGKFPDYVRVLPLKGDKVVVADKESVRQGLTRTAILSNEKFKGIRVILKNNLLQALANNPDHEEAEEEIEVSYTGGELEIGFNVVYLLDAVGAINTEQVRLELSTPDKSCLIQGYKDNAADPSRKYVVMPMRL